MAPGDSRQRPTRAESQARFGPKAPQSLRPYGWAIGAVLACTALNLLLFGFVSDANLILIYLLGLLPVALQGNRRAAIMAALMAALAFNYFFTEPTFTLWIDDLNDIFAFVAMGVVALIISALTAHLAQEVAALHRTENDLLQNARQLEQANRELREADRYKDEFLAALSHELRTPLSAVIGFGSMLDDGDAGPLTPEQKAYMKNLLTGANALRATVSDLLELSRIQAGKFSLSCSITEYPPLVHSALEDLKPLAAEKGVTLDVSVPVDGEVVLDGERVMSVIHNLVENALKFTPSGGTVTVHGHAEGDVIVTEVRDTGTGIPPEALTRLFKRFQQVDMSSTRPSGGLGMGLAICKAIVEAHGGKIGVMSESGRGSTFWFTLPRKAALAACAKSLPPSLRTQGEP